MTVINISNFNKHIKCLSLESLETLAKQFFLNSSYSKYTAYDEEGVVIK